MTFDEYHEILYANRPEMAPPDWNGGAGQTEQEQSGGLRIGVYGENGETRDATEDESNNLISYLNDTANSFNERFAQIQDYISNGAFTPDDSSKYSSMLTEIEKEIEDSRSTVYDLGWRGVDDVYSEWSGIAGEIRTKLDEKKPNEETDILGAYNKPYSYDEYVKSLDAAYEEAKAEKKSISSKINNYSPKSSTDEYSGWATDDLTALNMSGVSGEYSTAREKAKEARDALNYAKGIQASAQAIKEAEKEAALEARYKGMTYDDVQREIQAGSSDSEWLTAHQYDQMFFPDAQRRDELISEKQSQLDEIVSQLNTAKTELAIQSAREEEGIDYNAETAARAKQTVSELTAQKDELESAINTLRNNKYFSEQEEKYSSYAEKISQRPTEDALMEIVLAVERDDNGNDFLANATWDEKSILQYIYNNEGRKAAQEYYDYVSYAVNQKATEKYVERMAERAEKNPVLWNAASVPMNLGAGAGYIDALRQNAANRFTGEYKPIDYYTPAFRNSRGVSTIRGVTAQNIVDKTGSIELDEKEHPVLAPLLNGKSLGDAYQLGMSTLDSAATAALSVFGLGAVGSAFLGGAAATDGILQALERGATDSQALAMGTYNGVFEALGEYASIGKLIKEPTKVLASLLTQAGVEASEEVFTTIANTIADAATMRDKSEYKQSVNQYISDGMSREEAEKRAFVDTCVGIIWDGIGGAVMGGVSGAGHAGLYYGANAVKGNLSYKGNAQELLSKAEGTAQDSEAYRLAGEYQGRRMTNKMAAQLYEAINTADVQSLKAAVSEQLGQMNVTENADNIAEAVAKSALGQELSEEQKRVVENDENAKELLRELNDGLYSLDRAKNAKDLNWIYNAKTQGSQTGAQQIKTFQDFVKQAAEQEKKGTVPNVRSDTFNIAKVQGTDVRITGISQDGQIKGVLPDGESVDVSSENLSAGQRQYFELLRAEYGKDAGAIFKILGNGSGDLNKAYYGARTLMAVARNSSKANFDENIRKNLQSSLSALSDKQAEAIWSLAKSGQRMSAERLRRQYKNRITNENVTINGEVFRGIDFSEDFSDDVSFAISLADTLAGAAKGRLTVNLYHGGEDSKVFGRYENGRIDLNIDRVDKSGKSMVMYTLSHELTHYIKEASGAKYRTFAEVLTDHIMDEEGKTLERLIQEKKARDNGISDDEAMDEIVADGCELMLENTEIFNKLAQKDKSLAQQVADHIKGMLKRLYEGITGKHYEAKVAQKYISELQELWDNALEDALTSEESDTETGESVTETTNNKARKSIQEINNTEMRYVQADRQILYGNDPDEWGEQLTRYINKEIRNGRDVLLATNDGEIIKLTATTAEKGAFRNVWYDKNGRVHLLTDSEYETKLNAEAHIDELIQTSEDKYKNKPNIKDENNLHGEFANKGWRYRRAYFMDHDGKYYELTISVAYGKSGKIAYNISNMKERSFPQVRGSSNTKTGAQGGKASFKERISHSDEKSKRKSVADIEHYLTDSDGNERSTEGAGQNERGNQMFVQGTERKLTVQREFYKMFRSITETNNADWKRKYRQMTNNPMKELVEWGLKDENGNSVATSRGMMLQAYMLLNQEDSFKSLRIGGFRLANMKEYYHGNISEAYGIGSVLSENLVRQYGDVASEIRALRESMNDENADTVEAQIEEKLEVANDILLQAETNLYGLIDQIEKQLTDFDRAVLDAAREWYDYSGKKLDEINLEMYGIKKPRPKNYTPIHRDTTSVMSVDIRSMQDTVNLENLGSTKQRVRSTAPILLTDIFYELDSNQQKMSNFFGFVKVQNDFNKIYKMKAKRGGQSIEGKIARKFGSGTKSFTVTGTQYVENYIRSVAGGAGETSVLGGLFGNAAQATLTLNPRVAVSQLASIPTAAAVVGWDNVLKGFYRGMKTSFSKSSKEQLAETSVWFWQRYRGTGGITEVADMKANRGNVISRTWNQIASTKVGGALFNWCQDMDVLATASMYAMAEEKAKKLGIDITSYAGKKRVNEIYTEIIRKTQPNYTATERSDMLRDHRDSLKVLTMYKTQSNQNLNILIEAAGEFNRAKRDFKRGAATEMDVREARIKLANASTAVVLGGTVAFAGLRFLANLVLGTLSNYRDDDEELTKDSIIKGLAKDIGSSFSGMFALSGNLYDAFYSAFSGERYYGLSDTALSNIGSVLSNTVTLINKAMDENRNIELKDIDKEISSLCNIIGIPYGNSKKIIDAVKMWYNDIRNGTFGRFEGNVERSDSQNINRFLHAYVDGDTEKMDSVYAEMLGDGDWRRKKELEGKFKSKVFKMFVEERTIDADMVMQLLMEYSGLADYQAESLVNEWQGIIDYGFDSSEASDAYVNGEMSVEEYSIYLSTVKGYDADKISSEIKNLNCKRDTGMAYNELHDAYMYDAVSSSEAKKLINKYSNDDTDADQLVARWDFEKQTGYTWSNVHKAFKANKVSEAELKNYYQRIYGDTEEEAAVYVEIAKWKRDVPGAENFTKAQYNNYLQGQTYLEAANVSKSMFAEVAYAYHNDPALKSDKDENGNSITNSKLKKVMAYIDSLNISADQKTALALSFYKSKSNVNKYKLW